MAPRYRIGTSGWNYETFIGSIYTKDTPKRRYLEVYAKFFDTVELNASFYRSFPEKTWLGWYNRTPKDFLWSVKAPRLITHVKRLDVEKDSIDMFFDRARILREKLGVVLFQLPPSLKYQGDIFRSFLSKLPDDCKMALEARNESWFCQEVFSELSARNIAWVISHTSGRYPMKEIFTADFTYLRLHGASGLYRGAYGQEGLKHWRDLLLDFGKDAFVYFDNTEDGSAPRDALLLKEMMQNGVV